MSLCGILLSYLQYGSLDRPQDRVWNCYEMQILRCSECNYFAAETVDIMKPFIIWTTYSLHLFCEREKPAAGSTSQQCLEVELEKTPGRIRLLCSRFKIRKRSSALTLVVFTRMLLKDTFTQKWKFQSLSPHPHVDGKWGYILSINASGSSQQNSPSLFSWITEVGGDSYI